MGRKRTLISAFVVLWMAWFHYESLRHQVLAPLAGRELPKTKFLFPPAGWSMFYRVEPAHGGAAVFGLRGTEGEPIDPHRIFATRWVGYDNIRRNILVTVLNQNYAPDFCRYLRRKFPQYEGFGVAEVWVPDVREKPQRRLLRLAYRC